MSIIAMITDVICVHWIRLYIVNKDFDINLKINNQPHYIPNNVLYSLNYNYNQFLHISYKNHIIDPNIDKYSFNNAEL